MRSVIILCAIVALGQSVTEKDFFPFGPENGDRQTPTDIDGYVGPFNLDQTIYVDDDELTTMYVHNNGILTSGWPIHDYVQPSCLYGNWGPENTIIAYWAHADLSQGLGGTVYFRLTNDSSLTIRALQEIKAVFPLEQLTVSSVLIVTWYQIPFQGAAACGHTKDTVPTNTFQAIVAGDEKHSFGIYYYSNLTWNAGVNSGGNCSGIASHSTGQPAVAGWGNDNDHIFPLNHDVCTINACDIMQKTNTDAPGKWVVSFQNLQPRGSSFAQRTPRGKITKQ